LQPERANVNRLVAQMTKLLERTLGEDIKITLELDEAVWPTLVDPAQLESSLVNLATNSRDAMPNGGELRIVTGNRHLDADYVAQYPDVRPGDYAMIEGKRSRQRHAG
jgi:signal transduction histidine kinase